MKIITVKNIRASRKIPLLNSNPPLIPPPRYGLIGHRGVAGLKPENTLLSFEHAAKLGLNWIEFDVRLTQCNQWIILHDETLERTTNGKGPVHTKKLEDLQKLEAGLWFNPPYPDLKIPTLQETMELAIQKGLYTNIEVKGSDQDPEKHVELMAQFLESPGLHLTFQPLISSFELPFLIALRKRLPTIPIGYLVENITPSTWPLLTEHRFNTLHCDVEGLRDTDVSKAHQHPIPLLVYTINTQSVADHWLKQGVTGIFTDRPDQICSSVTLPSTRCR